MKILTIKTSTVVEAAFEDSEALTTVEDKGKTWYLVDGGSTRWDIRPSTEYTLYTDVTLPSGYEDDKFKYDGSSFTANADFVEDESYFKVINGIEWLCVKDDEGVERMIHPKDDQEF